MNLLKKIVPIILTATMLSGCSVGGSGTDLTAIPSMSLDEVAGSRIVASTNLGIETEIYNYISDRIVVEEANLIDVSTSDEANITNLLANINTQLTGKGGEVLTDEYANYLLLCFARTPYEWQQSNKEIVGFDPAARLYFVDVTYTTTNTYKTVIPDSIIANGAPDSTTLKQARYIDYMNLLMLKQKNDEGYLSAYTKFVSTWGSLSDIFNEQQGVTLYERTQESAATSTSTGMGSLTYSGLVSDSKTNQGATMTVRYVLQYALNLGEETDLVVDALYLKGYEINDYQEVLDSYTLSDTASLEVLKPFIDQLILSYNKCVEESNHIGLYTLIDDYGRLDKYYDEIRDYTYTSFGGYTYEILERKNNGKEVAVRVNRISQERAKGSEMSLPTYEEILVVNIILGTDDTISIKDINLVKSTLIGEPLSVIKNVTGISELIQYSDVAFSDDNKAAVESLVKEFSQVVTNSDYSSQAFLDVVDLGVSSTTLTRMADTIAAIVPTRKSTYIISWDTTTNVYCSLTIREVFECENGNYDTEAVLDVANRNGEWKVVNYTRTVNIKTSASTLDESLAICVDTRETEGETTEIESTAVREEVEVLDPSAVVVEEVVEEVVEIVEEELAETEGDTELDLEGLSLEELQELEAVQQEFEENMNNQSSQSDSVGAF